MHAVAFDTLKLAQRLRDEVKFPPEQAEKAASVLSETFGDWQNQQELATKADLSAAIEQLRLSAKTDLAETKADLIKWVLGIAFAQTGLLLGVFKLHG
jgi:nucleoside-diphosphate-sugar epimerase